MKHTKKHPQIDEFLIEIKQSNGMVYNYFGVKLQAETTTHTHTQKAKIRRKIEAITHRLNENLMEAKRELNDGKKTHKFFSL